jgi:hypothetical protein
MSLPSDYLVLHPELVPPSGGYYPPRTMLSMAFISFQVEVKGTTVKITPSVNVKTLPNQVVHVRALPQDLRVTAHYGAWHKGEVVSVSLVIRPVIKKRPKGVSSVLLYPKKGAIPSAIKILNARVGAIRSTRTGGKNKQPFPSSSVLRPNPETLSRPYLHVHEAVAPGSSSISSIPKGYTTYERIWSGVRTPGFGHLKPKQLPINSTTSRIKEIDDGPGCFLNHIPSTGVSSNWFTSFTEFYPPPPDPVAHVPGAEFKALRKLIEKAHAGIEANLAQDYAQIHQLVDLIGGTTRRITTAFVNTKKGNFYGAATALWGGGARRIVKNKKLITGKNPSAPEVLANNWLELQYGWKPLLQDIHGAFESLAQIRVADPFTQRVTASAVVTSEDHLPIFHRNGPSKEVGLHNLYNSTTCKYVLRYRVDDHLQQFLHQTGFANPINLGWEVLPFSFVVDWFTPVGPFLETLSQWNGVTFVDGSVSLLTRRWAQSIVRFAGAVPEAPGQLWEENAKYTRQITQYERGRLTTFPTAYMPSGFKNGLKSITHAANGLALMVSAFGGKKPIFHSD